jgi:hypothetical protein
MLKEFILTKDLLWKFPLDELIPSFLKIYIDKIELTHPERDFLTLKIEDEDYISLTLENILITV